MSGVVSSGMNRFYVYEHWRSDTDLCFWVGKGTGDRARRFKRNAAYNAITTTLSDLGMCVEVRMVADGLSEIDALKLECDRIAFWKSIGIELTNRSDGGSGNRGMFVSEETRSKIRAANLGKKHSPETKAKMSASQLLAVSIVVNPRGRPAGFSHSPETRMKMAKSQPGKPLSEQTKEKIRLANLGKKASDETRAKMSISHKGNIYGRLGRGIKRSAETRARMSAAQKGRIVSEKTRLKISAALKRRQEDVT